MPIKVVVLRPDQVGLAKKLLEEAGLLRKHNKVVKCESLPIVFEIFTVCDELSEIKKILGPDPYWSAESYEAKEEHKTLSDVVKKALHKYGLELTADLELKLPRKWSVYPPMMLFKTGTFDSLEWKNKLKSVDSEDFFKFILSLSVFPDNTTHLAVNKPIIESDVMRRPFNIEPVYGDFGAIPLSQTFDSPTASDFSSAFWCTAVQNGIYQTWAPFYTMFSRGNIKEKARILDFTCDGSVVDMYGGIGYFTLSYLKIGAPYVFSWELNPWLVEGMVRGATKNGFRTKRISHDEPFTKVEFELEKSRGTRLFVFAESNEHAYTRLQQLGPMKISHMNLGLLPTSKLSWPFCRDIIDSMSSGKTTVHVHENVHVSEIDVLQQLVAKEFEGHVLHVEKVKTFAPDVWHVVVDVTREAR